MIFFTREAYEDKSILTPTLLKILKYLRGLESF